MLQLGHSVEEAPHGFDMTITGVLRKTRSLACSLVVSIGFGGIVASATGELEQAVGLGCGLHVGWVRLCCLDQATAACSLDSGVGSALKRASPVVHTDGCQPELTICLPAAPVIPCPPALAYLALPATASASDGTGNNRNFPRHVFRSAPAARHKVPAATDQRTCRLLGLLGV